MATKNGGRRYFSFVLHGHLPYVLGHGGWPHGTDWLFEAACETYLPLIRTFRQLLDEGIKGRVTMGVTPVLAEQLADPAFAAGLDDYLEIKIRAAHDDAASFHAAGQPEPAALADSWRDFYGAARLEFAEALGGDIIGAFRALQDEGALELVTCAATHAYLPLLGREESIGLQLRAAVNSHRRHFGRAPAGVWLPECAYRPAYEWRYPLPPWSERPARLRPGLEEPLARAGLKYFFVDTHLLTGGKTLGVYAARFEALRRIYEQMVAGAEPSTPGADITPHRPYYVGAADPAVACFVRDAETGLVVWSSEHGYPGDGWYLDFHKKHFPGGLRYWRVTAAAAGMDAKEPYRPGEVPARITENADHFAALVRELLSRDSAPSPMLAAPYDAELFGHWWHEGPAWLGEVLRRLDAAPDVELATCGEYLEGFPPDVAVALPEGSWGEGGFHGIWLNPDTEWSWRLIYGLEDELVEQAGASRSPLGERLFEQALREFMLLASSDWQFLITTGTARDYAESRIRGHYESARRLLEILGREREGAPPSDEEMDYLAGLEEGDRLFPDLKAAWFAPL
jgi:1,4-alpha-glucan branching enzyme